MSSVQSSSSFVQSPFLTWVSSDMQRNIMPLRGPLGQHASAAVAIRSAIESHGRPQKGLARVPHQALSGIVIDAAQLGVWRLRRAETALNRPMSTAKEPNAEMGR